MLHRKDCCSLDWQAAAWSQTRYQLHAWRREELRTGGVTWTILLTSVTEQNYFSLKMTTRTRRMPRNFVNSVNFRIWPGSKADNFVKPQDLVQINGKQPCQLQGSLFLRSATPRSHLDTEADNIFGQPEDPNWILKLTGKIGRILFPQQTGDLWIWSKSNKSCCWQPSSTFMIWPDNLIKRIWPRSWGWQHRTEVFTWPWLQNTRQLSWDSQCWKSTSCTNWKSFFWVFQKCSLILVQCEVRSQSLLRWTQSRVFRVQNRCVPDTVYTSLQASSVWQFVKRGKCFSHSCIMIRTPCLTRLNSEASFTPIDPVTPNEPVALASLLDPREPKTLVAGSKNAHSNACCWSDSNVVVEEKSAKSNTKQHSPFCTIERILSRGVSEANILAAASADTSIVSPWYPTSSWTGAHGASHWCWGGAGAAPMVYADCILPSYFVLNRMCDRLTAGTRGPAPVSFFCPLAPTQ